MTFHEVNFDGLVGPTHNYGGLSFGNVASIDNARCASNPRAAALQGLEKMRALLRRGLKQAVLPPHERPHLPTLRGVGFDGDDAEVLRTAHDRAPELLVKASSASAMWAANAATVSPSPDTADGRAHFTPANLSSLLHRSIEHEVTGRVLGAIFPEGDRFAHHAALPHAQGFGDEGAANHTRLCIDYGAPGVELFVYGHAAFHDVGGAPSRFPARQTHEASQAVARLHGLSDRRAVFAQQNPQAIDAGVFHNDVIAVGNGDALFCHEQAFLDRGSAVADIESRLGAALRVVEVPKHRVSMRDAVRSYLFNSMLIGPPGGTMSLIAPRECETTPAVKEYLDDLTASGGPIGDVAIFDLHQSMRNGGGPACLRLRVVLSDEEIAAATPGVFLDEDGIAALEAWVERRYRDRLTANDLADPSLLNECRSALDELTGLLGLGSIYDFQR